MDRSVAGRAGIGRPVGPVGRSGTNRGRGRGSGAGAGGWPARLRSRLAPAGRGVSALRAWLAHHRRLAIGLLALTLALPLLAAGWLWLRNSSLVAVEHVRISGVHGPEARAIDLALEQAARRMSTLNVHEQPLLSAVAPYRVVRELHVSPSFPHGLGISVREQLPVASLAAAGGRTAVAADGVVLGPALLSPSLPVLYGPSRAGSERIGAGQSVRSAALLASLVILGAAPARMAGAILRAFNGPDGVTVVLRGGVRVFFGDGSRPHAKWLSLESVLADAASAGALYVDVRVPERPAAGLSAAAAAANASALAQSTAGTETSSAGELAGDLAAALGGSSSSAGAAAAPAQGTVATPAQAPAAGAGEAPSTTSAEGTGQAPAEAQSGSSAGSG